MPFSPGAQAALLKWINTFPLDKTAEHIEDLYDGIILSQALQDLDPSYDGNDIERNTGPSKWLSRKRNLQTVYKSLFKYIHRECPGLDHQSSSADFPAFAENPDPAGACQVSPPPARRPSLVLSELSRCSGSQPLELDRATARGLSAKTVLDRDAKLSSAVMKLVSVFLAAAVLGAPNRDKYIRQIQTLDQRTQAEIMAIIVQKQAEVEKAAESAELNRALDARVMESRDVTLAQEEELLTLVNEREALKKKCADLMTRHEHLQDSYDRLKDAHEIVERQLQLLQEAQKAGQGSDEIISHLQAKIREQEDLIATQESQAEADRTEKARLRKDIAVLTQKSNLADKLDEQLKEERQRSLELEKRANKAAQYEKKLQMQQEEGKSYRDLQNEMEELRQMLVDYNQIKERNRALTATEKEYVKALGRSEQHLREVIDQKRLLEVELVRVQDQLARLEERRVHDEHFIQELQEQVRAGGAAAAVTSDGASSVPGKTSFPTSLDDELKQSESPVAGGFRDLEISRLQNENKLLRDTLASTETAQLRQELADAREERARADKKFFELFEENAVLKERVSGLVARMDGKELVEAVERGLILGNMMLTPEYYRSGVVRELQGRTQEVEAELARERSRVEELQQRLADAQREVLAARADVAAMGKEGVEALEELKKTDQLVSASLRDELAAARSRIASTTADLQRHKDQLVEVLLAKDNLRRDLDEARELAAAAAAANAQSGDDAAATAAATAELLRKNGEKLDKLRSKYRTLKEVSIIEPPTTPIHVPTLHQRHQQQPAGSSSFWFSFWSRLGGAVSPWSGPSSSVITALPTGNALPSPTTSSDGSPQSTHLGSCESPTMDARPSQTRSSRSWGWKGSHSCCQPIHRCRGVYRDEECAAVATKLDNGEIAARDARRWGWALSARSRRPVPSGVIIERVSLCIEE